MILVLVHCTYSWIKTFVKWFNFVYAFLNHDFNSSFSFSIFSSYIANDASHEPQKRWQNKYFTYFSKLFKANAEQSLVKFSKDYKTSNPSDIFQINLLQFSNNKTHFFYIAICEL